MPERGEQAGWGLTAHGRRQLEMMEAELRPWEGVMEEASVPWGLILAKQGIRQRK